MNHHTRLGIDTGAYENNIRVFLRRAGGGRRLCAVVKADAYGHGLERIAPAAARAGAAFLGVTENAEARAIRNMGIDLPVWRLRPAAPGEAEDAADIPLHEIAGSLGSARLLSAAGLARGVRIPVFVKLDTGIGRMGFSIPHDSAAIGETLALPGIRVEGLMTHFPCADETCLDITRGQLETFRAASATFAANLEKPTLIHSANSAAALRLPGAWLDAARAGIASYGLAPSPDAALPEELRPVMRWSTTVVQVRNVPPGTTIGYGMTYKTDGWRVIATLPVGYADGYVRNLSNSASVLIGGVRCPVVGRVSMNMTTVDATGAPGIRIGDEAVLLGESGGERIAMEDLAGWADTITYELACLIGACNRYRAVGIGREEE